LGGGATPCAVPHGAYHQAEILYAIGPLPEGPHGSSPGAEGLRRAVLMAAATALFAEDFAEPILRSKGSGARHPEVVLARRQAGNPVEKFDALIAATALAAGASIGFAGRGLMGIDPWTASQ